MIVLKDNYDRVIERLIEASKSLEVGLPEDPGTVVGPVIDQAAYERILCYVELGKKEGKLAFEGKVPPGEGYLIPPQFSPMFRLRHGLRRRKYSGRYCAC